MITADELLKTAPALGRRNYKKNSSRRRPEGIINGQRRCVVSDFRLGLRKVSSNGCGAIAIYNALFSTGQQCDFSTISLGIEKYALRLGGILGTDPKKLENYFKNMKIAAVCASDYEDFVRVMNAVRAGILCYWVAKPGRSLLHYVAIINNRDGTFSVCNRFANRSKPSVIDKIEKLCPKECYKAGFFMN